MQYSPSDYEFLGRQVAAGKYIARTTTLLALILALLGGICMGRYIFPDAGPGADLAAGEQKRPLGQNSDLVAAVSPNKQLFDSIIQHEEQVRVEPGNVEAWEHLGNLYFDANEPQKAVNAYEKALAQNPRNAGVLVDCGVMYRNLKQYDKAMEYFGKALAVNPRHEFALFNSGIVLYHDLNRKEEALKLWGTLVSINPEAKAPNGELVSTMLKDHEVR